MLSRTIEVQEFSNKKFVCDFQIASMQYDMFGRSVTTNKWLRFEEWQQLYEKLEKMLSEHSDTDLGKLCKKELFLINNVEVKIEVLPLQSCYWELFSLTEDEVVPVILSIKVNRADANELNKRLQKLERFRQECKTSNIRKKEMKTRVRKDVCREYDPVQVSGRKAGRIPHYKPYKPTAKIDSPLLVEEEYSPKPISNSEGTDKENLESYNPNSDDSPNNNVPLYIPSEIKSPEDKDESQNLSSSSVVNASDLNSPPTQIRTLRPCRKQIVTELPDQSSSVSDSALKHDVPVTRSKRKKRNDNSNREKRRLSKDLFGSDDSEHEYNLLGKDIDSKNLPKRTEIKTEENEECKKSSRHKLKLAASDSDQLKNTYTEITETKEPEDKKKGTGSNESSMCGKKKRKRMVGSSSTQDEAFHCRFSPEEQEHLRVQHEKEMKILKCYKEEMQALNKDPAPTEIIKLNHLSPEELIVTFTEVKPILDKHFKAFKRQKTHEVKAMQGMDPSLIMSIIDYDNLLPLMNHLKANYEDDPDNNVPYLTELFVSLLLPEWILAIFMKELNLERSDAIERIKIQNQMETSTSSNY